MVMMAMTLTKNQLRINRTIVRHFLSKNLPLPPPCNCGVQRFIKVLSVRGLRPLLMESDVILAGHRWEGESSGNTTIYTKNNSKIG